MTEQSLPPMLPELPGFKHINRYWDKTHDSYAAKILPGEYYVTMHDELIVTVLGSCVSACVRDKVFGIGGMNHFMLPADKGDGMSSFGAGGESTRYGNFAMEQMINDILKNGGHRKNLEIKVFGGGRVLKNMSTLDIGQKNIDFIMQYIKDEALNLTAEDLGDVYPRKVLYFPASGRVRVKKLRTIHNNTIIEREKNYCKAIEQKPISGEIELF
ncbi:MAG: chemoreceptor glutamine deamidase CheD [Gammaproteobacteria bacterium]|nr:chemoreceptor glutamine deamidase CheD [Gammaproteobacteria bacterium]MCW8986725.1 chemoreceptor glutamine deamidase CheD [Gammaproteobacteria bacterium]MCW9030014.1 chemoreceptor glutamine deamidase CheD [Gammaproteobacteria bacterium]